MKNNIKEIKEEQIEVSGWKEYIVSNLFKVEIAKSIDKGKLKENKNGINYITRKSTNNGLEYRVENIKKLKNIGKCLTVSMVGANKGTCFYQEKDFLSSQNMLILRNENISSKSGLFLVNCFEKIYRISSDYHAIKKNDTLKDKIKLPSRLNTETNKYEPDWKYMEDYISNLDKELNIQKIKSNIYNIKNIKKEQINISNWKEYVLEELFKIKGSKTTSKNILEKKGIGKYPYITTTSSNQGVSGYYDFYTEKGNVLTFDSAVLGTCFYQEKDFSASDHIELGIPYYSNFNNKIGLFFQIIINKTNNGIYHYGHKCNQLRIKKTVVKLPSILNNETNKYEPDWKYMEDYIINLEKEININLF